MRSAEGGGRNGRWRYSGEDNAESVLIKKGGNVLNIEFLSDLAAVTGVCIASVNVIVEVLKAFWLKEETSRPLAVFITSELIVFFVVGAYCVLEGIKLDFMIGTGAFFGGFFIAYGAMFGYDKLYGEAIKNFEKFFIN